ncbi:MAG: efflux RND transporter permease subunit [Firmicutes bacterium]|nr:efflux RND transporter permease subunit [Bacillota bacterium]
MKLWEHSVRRPVATTMLVLAVILLGVVALTNLRLELLPRLNAPVVAAITSYPGASAREVSSLVTEPIEAAAATTPGVTDCRSISQEGVSVVILEFTWGTDMAEARANVAERVDQVNLPEGARRPFLVKFDPTLMPVMSLTVATEGDLGETTTFAREVLKPRLESIDGVAAVEVFGSSEPEVRVSLDPGDLERYGLTQEQVANVIRASNLDWPLGSVRQDGRELGVRLSGRLQDLDDLRDLVVGYQPVIAAPRTGAAGSASSAGVVPASSPQARQQAPGSARAVSPPALRPIRLGDVARVERAFAPSTSISRTGGNPSVELSIQKEGDANTVQVARRLREELDAIRRDYPEAKIFVAMDQARIIEMFLGTLRENLLIGGALAVLVLFLFLRHLASTFAIAVAIPFSVVATFVLLHFSGLTLNIMTLGGLALGVGMLVDNAIVVIESVFRHLERGEDPRRAAVTGTSEVAMAITASTLTTLAVFLPVVFVGGITGHLFRELAVTVSFALASSLVVAVTLVPAMAAHLFRMRGRRSRAREGAYARTLRWCLRHRLLIIAVVLLALGGAGYLATHIGTEFLPVTDEGAFSIDIAMPAGTDLGATSAKAAEVERILDGFPEVDLYTTTVGAGEGFGVVARGVTGGTSVAQILVNLVPEEERDATTAQVMERVRERVQAIRGPAQITFNLQSFASGASGMAWNSLQVYVKSLDPALLPDAADRVVAALRDVEGLRNLACNLEEAKPELEVTVDRDKALARGLTPAQVAMAVSNAVEGQTVTRVEFDSRSLPVRVCQDFGEFPAPRDVESLRIPTASGQVVRLGDVATLTEARGPVSVTRAGQRPSALITAQVEGRDLGSATADVRTALDGLDLPPGVTVEIGGASAMMEEGFAGLNLALALSVVLVYMVMATQFESLLHPLVIMFTLPLAFVGVVLTLYLTGTSLGITAYIGGIVLAGIVVNNGIVMVDYINQLRRQGLETREAIVRGAAVRLRPVLMTALTTLLGLLPLALGWGEGGELNAPLARAVVGGLTTSTVLTLLVIPVVYSVLAGSLRRLPTAEPAPESAGPPPAPEPSVPPPAPPVAPPPAPPAAPPGTLAAGSPPAAPGTLAAESPPAPEPAAVSPPSVSPGQPSVGPVPGDGLTMEEFSQLLEILGKLFLLVSKRGNPPRRPGV